MSGNDEMKSIELRSDEVQELLMRIPKGIVRWGTVLVAGIIVLLLAGAALFEYPDVIHSEVILTTRIPPVKLFSKTSGKIENLFVEDNQNVKKGDLIALIETAANYRDVLDAKKISEEMIRSVSFEKREVERRLELGEIQSWFSSFLREYNDYRNFVELNYHGKKIEALKQELVKYENYYKKLEEQSVIQNREYEIALRQFGRDSLLFIKGVLSTLDFEKSESALISKHFDWKETETGIAGARVELAKLNQQILEMELQNAEEDKERKTVLFETFEKLQAEIEIWKQKYLLITPVDGRITFSKFWSANQQVIEGEPVLTVIPSDTGKIIGKINLGVDGAGKVKKGQMVNIKFYNYPFQEFGLVQGRISLVSLVPEKNYYTAEVELVNGLVTNYDIPLEFQQEMPGEAEIITSELSLLRRIINPVKSVIKKHIG